MISVDSEKDEIRVVGDGPDILTEYAILTSELSEALDRDDILTNFIFGFMANDLQRMDPVKRLDKMNKIYKLVKAMEVRA